MRFVIRDGNSYVCQIDGSRFPYSDPATKGAASAAAQQRADEIIYAQTKAGVDPNASLAERQRRL